MLFELPTTWLISNSTVSSIIYMNNMSNWNRRLHSKLLFWFFMQVGWNAEDVHQTSCGILDKSVHVCSRQLKPWNPPLAALHLDLVWAGRGTSASSPQKWHQNCSAVHLKWHPLWCATVPSSAQPGSMLVHENSNFGQAKENADAGIPSYKDKGDLHCVVQEKLAFLRNPTQCLCVIVSLMSVTFSIRSPSRLLLKLK